MVEHRDDVARFDRAVGEDVEPRATEVRQSGVVDVEEVTQGADHPRVADDERRAVPASIADVTECAGHAHEDVLIALESIRLSSFLEEPWPLRLDLGTGESLPRADVRLLQTFVHFHWADTEVFGDDRRRMSGALKVTRGDQFERTECVCRQCGLAHTFVAEWNVGTTLPTFLDVPQGLSVSQDQQRTHHLATIHGKAG